jgi:NADP-dependent 3-hydroxy acid dehydrogenase YdfG
MVPAPAEAAAALGRAFRREDHRMAQPLVVITGASSGIGLGLARAFARDGNPLLLLSRHIEPFDDMPRDRTAYAAVDVADFAAVERAIRAAEARFGKTECLVNNAGFADARDFKSVDVASFSHEVDTNLKGVLNCTKVVLGDMSERKSGTIINVSSVSDRKTCPVAVTYTATKYAVRALGESLREAEGKNGVRVINVAPGYIRTNIHKTMGITFDEYCQALGNPDFLSVEELAEVILFCWKLPQRVCIRDIVVAPTRTAF